MATSGSGRPKTGAMHARNGPMDQSLPPEYTYKVMKKISQLTKVIYQLNTRSEEHNNFVQHLKTLHEDETKNLLSQSEERLKTAETKHSREVELLQEHMQARNDQIALLDNENTVLKRDNEKIKQKYQSDVVALKEKNAENVKDLSLRLAVMKKDLSDQRAKVITLEQWYKGSLQEAIGETKRRYEIEKEAFVRKRVQFKEELHQQSELHKLELKRMSDQYDLKLQEELHQASQSSDTRLARALQECREKEKHFADSSRAEVQELNEKLSTLSASLREAEDRYTIAEQKLRDVERMQEQEVADRTTLESQLQSVNASRDALLRQISNLKMEVEIEQEKYQQQSKEMKAMSALIAQLEAGCVDDSAKMKDLQETVKRLQLGLRELETERDSLLSAHKSTSKEHESAVHFLSEELRRMKKEKEDLVVQYGREIEAAQAQLSTREQELGAQHLKALQDSHLQVESLQAQHKADLESLANKMKESKDEEIKALRSSYDERIKSFEEELRKTQTCLLGREEEVANLKGILSDSKKGLGSASEQISQLEDELAGVRKDLRHLKSELGCKETECESLKTDVSNLKASLESTKRSGEDRLKLQKEKLTKELEEIWLKRIKEEGSTLRAELSQRHQEDIRTAVAEIVSRKEQELKAVNEKWRQEVEDLGQQIAMYEDKLRAAQQRARLDMETQQKQLGDEVEKLRLDIQKQKALHDTILKELKQTHDNELGRLREEHERSLKEAEERLVCSHTDELRNVRMADKIAVDALKDQLKKEYMSSLEVAQQEHKQALESLKEELSSAHQKDLQHVHNESAKVLEQTRKALSSELEQREIELVRQASTIDSLDSYLKEEQSVKEKYYQEVLDLKKGVHDLRRELERKGDEVLGVRREANSQLRQREQQLIAAHQVELDGLSAQNQKQLKGFLDDFNSAKEVMNTEIQSLNEQLKDAERRFSQRTSRPEDLETIRELKKIISQQEFRLKEVIAEKKLYQMELVNREQNYNKVFSANPMVGVLDPLVLKEKKKGSRDVGISGSRHASAPTLATPTFTSNEQSGNVSLSDSPLLNHKRTAATKTTVFPI